jgi:alpha-beta hydrolase superfamily lysophospholipase
VAQAAPAPSYDTVEVQFTHRDTVLVGLLLRPRDHGPHAAVVLLHGSGPVGRDGPGYLPPIREHFARQGIAALCYDKPGIGSSTGDWRNQTFDDRAAGRTSRATCRDYGGNRMVRSSREHCG